MGMKLKLQGFSEILEKIQDAGKDIDKIAAKCVEDSAEIIQDEYKAQMRAAGVDSGLIERMDPINEGKNGNKFFAEVGYKKGYYDPDNLSDGYKAIFINYGTPRISPRNFIEKMKKKAYKKVKKEQQKALEKILEELQ